MPHINISNVKFLISLVRDRPVIWDKSLESYKNQQCRAAAWREICSIMKNDYEEMEERKRLDYAKMVLKKWNQIRDSWLRSIKSSTKRSYIYDSHLVFLKKILPPSVVYVMSHSDNQETDDDEDVLVKEENESETMQKEDDSDPDSCSVNENAIEMKIDSKVFKRTRDSMRNSTEFNKRSCSCTEHQMKCQLDSQKKDRSLLFFKSLLPSLTTLEDDQLLEFQSGVINLLQNIKSSK